MRLQYVWSFAIGTALVTSLPICADQRHGGGQGQGAQSGQSISAGQQGATDQLRDQDRDRTRDRDQVYGWQLMTPAERQSFQSQMRGLKTQQERDALRAQHHAEMQKRAEEQGVTLPDLPRRSQSTGTAPVQERTEQKVEQEERSQQDKKEIEQKERTEQKEHDSNRRE